MGVRTFLVFAAVISGTLAESLYELRIYKQGVRDGQGRLDIYNNSKWIPFSVNHFSMQVADLACKNLGFIHASRYTTVGTLFYSESMNGDSTHMEIDCPSTAVSLSSCTYTLHNGYPHSTDVGLMCTTSKTSVRLYDFAGSTFEIPSGRLEYFVNETWGTVCSSYFTSSLGMVACQQLGFYSYHRYEMASQSSNYDNQTLSSTTIWFSRFTSCLSGKKDLRQCALGVGIRGNCSHDDDVILYCDSGTYSAFYDIGEVRLTDQRRYSISKDSSYMNGRLEVYIRVFSSYRWTPFCYRYFDNDTADSACRQLGFDGVSEYDTVQNLGYFNGSGTYSVSTYNDCPYSSTGFYSCTIRTVSNCSHDNDVGLVCYEFPYNYNALALGVGLAVGSLCLCTCLCMSIVMGVVIGGVTHHKSNSRKRMSRTPTVQYSRGSAGIEGSCHITQEPEKNNSTKVHLPLSNTAGISHAVAMQNVGTALQSNTAGVSETVVAPQNVVADLHSNGGAESNMEATGHGSGPSHNEHSVISHSDEQPLHP